MVRDVQEEVLDVGQLEKVVHHRGWAVPIEGTGRVKNRDQTKTEALPEDLMTALADEIGDGLAKVTVGAELSHSKDFGCKAQAFVSITVHCNNDDETIEKVQGILHDKARSLVNQDLTVMKEDRDQHIIDDGKPAGKQARGGASKANPKPTPKAGVKTGPKARPRPNYER